MLIQLAWEAWKTSVPCIYISAYVLRKVLEFQKGDQEEEWGKARGAWGPCPELLSLNKFTMPELKLKSFFSSDTVWF